MATHFNLVSPGNTMHDEKMMTQVETLLWGNKLAHLAHSVTCEEMGQLDVPKVVLRLI